MNRQAIDPAPLALTLALTLALASCAATDPYERPGMWQPEGVVAGNIAAMLDHPSDLRRGRGDPGVTRLQGQMAVARIWEGRERPLPNSPADAGPTPNGPEPPPTAPGGH